MQQLALQRVQRQREQQHQQAWRHQQQGLREQQRELVQVQVQPLLFYRKLPKQQQRLQQPK